MAYYEALYTETFGEFLDNQGTSYENEIKEKFDVFPKFDIYDDMNFNMWDMFKEKYDIREIGAETEQLFDHFLREKITEVSIRFVPKIRMFIDNFNDLFKFTVSLTLSDSGSSDNQNNYYLNPVLSGTENLKVQDVDKTNSSHSRIITRDVLQSVWGKTRADLMSKIFELRDIYIECLEAFQPIFMGVL